MEPLVAAHLHPQLSAVSSMSPSLLSKSDRFQSALTEKAYKTVVLSARVLNVLSLLTAYQAELYEDFVPTQDPVAWEEITVITDLCLCVQRCAARATGKALGTMVLQERARWLNLANQSDIEKEDVLDMPIGAGAYLPYPGSTCSEKISQEIEVQDANACLTSVDLRVPRAPFQSVFKPKGVCGVAWPHIWTIGCCWHNRSRRPGHTRVFSYDT
uniref:Uncharacterized protein n=1 Tax=Larimichthys crocea TaxID=215358 RepID=A0A0F8CZ58_LARCR